MSQNRDLWFALPPQQSLLVWWLFSAIPIPILKFPIFIHLVITWLVIILFHSCTTQGFHFFAITTTQPYSLSPSACP